MTRPVHRGLNGLTKALALLAFVLFVLWGSAAWANLRSARAEAARAEDRLLAVVDGISVQTVVSGSDIAGLQQAADELGAVEERLRSPLLRPVRPLPVLGRQLRSAQALVGTSARLADAAATTETRARATVAKLKEPGASRLDALARVAGSLRELEQLTQTADLGPEKGLVGGLQRSRDRAESILAAVSERLRSAVELLELGQEVLAGPSRYLLLVANNAEMRAGSGSYLSAGVLSASGGQLRLEAPRTVGAFRVLPGIVAPEADVAARWGWLAPTDRFQSLMLSPRFDASAPSAARMWELAGQEPVDGVLAVDVGAVVSLMPAIGTVQLDGIAISPATAQEELLHGQYNRFPDVATRRDGLQALAGEIFTRLGAGEVDLPALAVGLRDAARGRHLMAWSSRTDDQELWDRTGAHGRLAEASLLLSSLNFGSNKLDPHLRVEAALSNIPRQEQDATDHELRVSITNASLPDDASYVIGPNIGGLVKGEYFGVLTVNLPAFANQPSIEDAPGLAVYGIDGPSRVLGMQYRLPAGATRTIVVRFRTAGLRGWLRLEPSSRLPGVRWEVDGVRVPDGRPAVVRWPSLPPGFVDPGPSGGAGG